MRTVVRVIVICWLDQPEEIKFVSKKFEPGMQAVMKNEGAGGTTTFTFKALKKGNYVLNASQCPTGREAKECSEYNLKNITAENLFMIKVTD